MSPVLQHLEKIVLGVTCVIALIVVLAHLSGGSALRADAARVAGDVQKLDAALKDTKAPAGGAAVPVRPADPIVAGLTGAGAAAQPSRAWAFYRRPTLRGKAIEKPDLRKDHLPPVEVAATVQDFTITLTWKANPASTAALKGWRVYRYPKGGKRADTPTAELKPAALRWEDAEASSLQPGSTFTYEVTALTEEETKQESKETAPGGPVDAALPYDRRLHYHGGALENGDELITVTLGVSRFVAGDWRGPVEFNLKPGERVGGRKRIEIDGDQVEVDFTTHWTVVDADKASLTVKTDAGVETTVAKTERPPRVVDHTPKNKVDAELRRLLNERNAARQNGDHDAATAIYAHRSWLSGRKPRYLRGNDVVAERVNEDIESFGWDVEDLTDEIAKLEDSGRRSRIPSLQKKKADLEAKIEILKNLLK